MKPQSIPVNPVVRYPGGKQRVLAFLAEYLPTRDQIEGTYVEPFVGGASVFLRVNPRRAILADLNAELIDLYVGLRQSAATVWRYYSSFGNTKDDYHAIRSMPVKRLGIAKKAARTLYLNRTCFKGNWRHNSSGQFNVGYGGQSRRWVVTRDYLLSVAESLRSAHILCSDFESVLEECNAGDFVFLDPPYRRGERELSNDHYVGRRFTFDDHRRLASNFVSAHKYKVYSPDPPLLDLITNALVPIENRFTIGDLRLTECRLTLPTSTQTAVEVSVSTSDLVGARTALFGKTRLGKSNVVKLIAQSLLETTVGSRNVGQLIFDINGEYANDNPQDDNSSLRGAYPDRCQVYALAKKPGTPSKPLKLNFYDHPERAHRVLADLLSDAGRDSIYIKNFAGVGVPAIADLAGLEPGDKVRANRRLLMYWAILQKAGYQAPKQLQLQLDPGYHAALRKAAYGTTKPPTINTLDRLVTEFERLHDFSRGNPGSVLLQSTGSGSPLFENEDKALLEFLKPSAGAGVAVIAPYRMYHDPNAGNLFAEILTLLDDGETVILDLGNANPEVMSYFSEELSREVFNHQVTKFTSNNLGEHYVQLYFEEAHNLFPQDDDDTLDIYQRLAKEGAKYHIGMVYATQSVTSVNRDLLAQTENFFVAHLSSTDQVNALARVNAEFESLKDDILRAKTPGYIRMLTKSHRFVISMQAKRFTPPAPATSKSSSLATPV